MLKPRKNEKASKTNSEVTMLTEGDLIDIENTIQDDAQEAIDDAMSEKHIVLGELRT